MATVEQRRADPGDVLARVESEDIEFIRFWFTDIFDRIIKPSASRPRPERPVTIVSPMPRPSAGLCDSCRHQRVVRNTRGSEFSLCERSREDAAFPRYPRLPVTRCRGHEPRERARTWVAGAPD